MQALYHFTLFLSLSSLVSVSAMAAKIRLIPGKTQQVLVVGFDQQTVLVRTEEGKRVLIPRDQAKHNNLVSGSTRLQVFIPKQQIQKKEKI